MSDIRARGWSQNIKSNYPKKVNSSKVILVHKLLVNNNHIAVAHLILSVVS